MASLAANMSSSLTNVSSMQYFLWIFLMLLVRFIATALYNVYLHPLRKFPGPLYASISHIPYYVISYKGDKVTWTHRQHQRYGEVVRLGPDRLSYINPEAWKDIYGHRSGGRKENPKDTRFYGKAYNGEDDLLTIESPTEHGHVRKIFSNAFSDKALKLQESLIAKHVNKLIKVIQSSVADDENAVVDMVKLYNCTTFDIMADLTFGKPLGMLDQSEYTPWVKAVFGSIKAADLSFIGLEYPWVATAVGWLIPRSIRELEKAHFDHAVNQVNDRLAKGIDKAKPDIWNLVLERGQDQLSLNQMHANSSLFMTAGTETTATLLSGLTYYLLKNPDKLQKAVNEVRMLSEDELSLERLPYLPYLNACFEETLRMYPPVPTGVPRETPVGGSVICGEWLPAKTRVSVAQWAAFRSHLNFKDPDSFVPERWLPDSGYETDRKAVLQPFSVGPRNCIGKNLAYHEMRIIMAKVLWHFNLELSQQSDNWADQKVWSLWQKPELWCKAKPVSGN